MFRLQFALPGFPRFSCSFFLFCLPYWAFSTFAWPRLEGVASSLPHPMPHATCPTLLLAPCFFVFFLGGAAWKVQNQIIYFPIRAEITFLIWKFYNLREQCLFLPKAPASHEGCEKKKRFFLFRFFFFLFGCELSEFNPKCWDLHSPLIENQRWICLWSPLGYQLTPGLFRVPGVLCFGVVCSILHMENNLLVFANFYYKFLNDFKGFLNTLKRINEGSISFLVNSAIYSKNLIFQVKIIDFSDTFLAISHQISRSYIPFSNRASKSGYFGPIFIRYNIHCQD